MKWGKVILILFLTVTFASCDTQASAQKSKTENSSPTVSCNPDTLKIQDKGGESLRDRSSMPIYSNIPSN